MRETLYRGFIDSANRSQVLAYVAVGGVLAASVFAVSVVAIPLIIDRHATAGEAMRASVKAVFTNIPAMIVWSALILILTIIGYAPLLGGLLIIAPLFGARHVACLPGPDSLGSIRSASPMDMPATAAAGLDRDTLRRLSRRSDARGFLQLAAHGLLLCVTGVGVWASRGSLMVSSRHCPLRCSAQLSFCALHETVHRTAFASRPVNDAVAWACGVVLLLPCEYFRLFHFEHHRFTQDPARDPELAQTAPATLRSYLWRMSGLPNWTKRLTVTLGHASTGRVTETFVPDAKRPIVVREAASLECVSRDLGAVAGVPNGRCPDLLGTASSGRLNRS